MKSEPEFLEDCRWRTAPKSSPRWTPGSLAKEIAMHHGSYREQADAVERLTRAARRVREAHEHIRAYSDTTTLAMWCDLWDAIDGLRAAGEAAEKWGGR